MIRKILAALVVLLTYQVIAVMLLYTSNYLNVASYYTHPPIKGNIELRRLPVLFGDSIALKILNVKQIELEQLIRNRDIGLAAVLSSYIHNTALPKEEAKLRAFKVAELLILAGYDVSQCEDEGRSTAQVLEDWGMYDADVKNFLEQFIEEVDLYSCRVIG